jgi:hypothetical protein
MGSPGPFIMDASNLYVLPRKSFVTVGASLRTSIEIGLLNASGRV